MKIENIKHKVKDFALHHDWKIWPKVIMAFALVVLVIVDQMVKLLVQRNFEMDREYAFLPGFINFKYVLNHGSAFGFNQDRTAMLITIAFLIIFVLLTWIIFSQSVPNVVGVTFILAGTIGNLADRFLHDGAVVDFFAWQWFKPYTIFNTADIMITIGIIVIVISIIVAFILSMIESKKEAKREQKSHE